jgi:hypothetical protein
MGVAKPPPWPMGVVPQGPKWGWPKPPPFGLGVAGRPMWPKGVSATPTIFFFFSKIKIFKIIYIDFILFYFLTYPNKKRRGIQTSNFHFMWRGL